MNAFRHRFRVHSFFRSPIDISRPPSMRPPHAPWIDGSPQRLIFTTSKLLLRLLSSRNVLPHLHTEVPVLLRVLSRCCTHMVGSTPSTSFAPVRNWPRIAFRYTRATWMRLAMTYLGDWALGSVTLKRIVIPYHLPACHSFSAVYIQFLHHFGLGHPPHEVNHYYICFIPIYNSSFSPSFF